MQWLVLIILLHANIKYNIITPCLNNTPPDLQPPGSDQCLKVIAKLSAGNFVRFDVKYEEDKHPKFQACISKTVGGDIPGIQAV